MAGDWSMRGDAEHRRGCDDTSGARAVVEMVISDVSWEGGE